MDVEKDSDTINRLAEIGVNGLSDLSKEHVDLICKFHQRKQKNKNKVTYDISKRVPQTDPKFTIGLKFLNNLLVNIENQQPITNLLEFKNINRDDIIKKDNITMFENMQPELFEHFDKKQMGWYRRKRTNYYILSFFRYMVKMLGYKLQIEQITRVKNTIHKTNILYSIV